MSLFTYDIVKRSNMTDLYENIDPDGDTLITISYLAVLTQSVDEPVAAEEPDHKNGHSTFSNMDDTTHCHEGLGEYSREMLLI